jgi:hypothetical protein
MAYRFAKMTSVAEIQSFSSVPKLETNGANWMIFRIHLKWALEEKQVFSHFDGTTVKPADNKPDTEKMDWLNDETKACHLLAQKLHDSTLTKLLHHTTVAEMWTAVTQEFMTKSSHVVAAMCASFDSLNCADNRNICTHLDRLRFKYEELVGIWVTILSTDYATRIIGLLPTHHQRHLSTIKASARASTLATSTAQATPKQTFLISSDLLIQLATEEFDRLQYASGQQVCKVPRTDTGIALAAFSNPKHEWRPWWEVQPATSHGEERQAVWHLLELWG